MSSVIVTGASGFIGRVLVRSLRAAGHKVTGLDHAHGDVATPEYWRAVPPAAHVVHLAGRSFVPGSWAAPAEFLTTNVIGTSRVVDFCRASRAHLVFVSAYVYGIPQRLPIDEGHPVTPNNPYALSKTLAERVCSFHAESTQLPVTIVRPFNIFGPGQRSDFLIPSVVDQIVRGREIRVKDLSPRRDYLFVDDFVAGLGRTLANPDGLRVVNFGSGTSHSVRDVIDQAQAAAGSCLPVVCDDVQRPNEIPDVRADIGQASRFLGWEPRTSLIEGLRLSIEATRRDATPADIEETLP